MLQHLGSEWRFLYSRVVSFNSSAPCQCYWKRFAKMFNMLSLDQINEDGTFLATDICPNQGDRIIFRVERASGLRRKGFGQIFPIWRSASVPEASFRHFAPIFGCSPLRSRGRRRSLRSGASRLRSGCAAVHARSTPNNRKCPRKCLQLSSGTPASAKSERFDQIPSASALRLAKLERFF